MTIKPVSVKVNNGVNVGSFGPEHIGTVEMSPHQTVVFMWTPPNIRRITKIELKGDIHGIYLDEWKVANQLVLIDSIPALLLAKAEWDNEIPLISCPTQQPNQPAQWKFRNASSILAKIEIHLSGRQVLT